MARRPCTRAAPSPAPLRPVAYRRLVPQPTHHPPPPTTPPNHRFVLVSDSCVPLYDPLTVYQQLMHEDQSRIKVCSAGSADMPHRWSYAMQVTQERAAISDY